MSKKSPSIATADKPVVLRPSSACDQSAYSKQKTATNKKIAAHKHRSG